MRTEMARISCLMCVVIGARHVKQKPSRLRTALVPDAVGGNGGNAAADAIQEECEKQGVHTIVAACPKSIDSDILVVSHVLCSTHIIPSLFPVIALGLHDTV